MRRGPALGAGVLTLGLAVAVTPTHAASGDRRFAPPMHVDVDNLAAEPSIAVAPDGTEYIVAPAGLGVRAPSPGATLGVGGDFFWRSTDHGRTWTGPGSYDMATGGADSDIAVGSDGTLYASGLTYPACASISKSTNRGDTWVGIPMSGCAQFPVENDRQWNATYGASTLYTVVGDLLGGSIDLIRSRTSGLAVLPSTTLRLSKAANYQWPGTVDVDQRNGRTYTVWNTTGAPNNCDGAPGSDDCKPAAASTRTRDRILVSVLPDGATSAPAPRVVAARAFDTFDSFAVVGVDHAGGVYVVWTERHPASAATWTMLSASHDGGLSWSGPVKVNRAPRTTAFAWVTAGDRGRIAVSYYGTAAAGRSPQTVGSSAGWAVYSSFSTDGGRTFREYRTTGAMNRGPICTSGLDCADGTRNLLDFFETDLDRSGCLVTSYADNTVDRAGAVVSYVRQTAGPGLLAGRACAVRG